MSVDLSTRYLGLELDNPIVVAACPLTGSLPMLERLAASGAAAAVLPSLFEEQIEREGAIAHWLSEHETATFSDSLDYFPNMYDYNTGPDGYLRLIEVAKNGVPIPIIGSLNGATEGGWIHFAQQIEQAGADALELNICFVPTNPDRTALEVEQQYLDVVTAVREAITIPLAVKIGSFFTALPNFARRLVDAGANGLVLFNRFLEPEISLEKFEVQPHLQFSSHAELRLPLRWIAILRDHLDISLAVTSGVHSVGDPAKAILVGADAVMLATALLRHGPDYISLLLSELEQWLEAKDLSSVEAIKGRLSLQNCPDPTALERANYLKALLSFRTDDS